MKGTSFRDRLSSVVERVGSAAELARRSGISDRSIRGYIAGETEPKADVVVRLAVAAGVSVEWLLTGEGEPLVTGRGGAPREGYVHLPLYDVRAAAGGGRSVDEERVVNVLAFREDWIRSELRARPQDLSLIYVEGDSMEPLLRSGDIILVDHTDTEARREGIYVMRLDGALVVKQVQRLPGAVLRLVSANPAYEPFTLRLEGLDESAAIIGRVVWACRRF